MLTIILTSYNRPNLLRRAIDSLLAQTDDRWHCILCDDGSDAAARAVVDALADHEQFTVVCYDTDDETRGTTSRYATLINEQLDRLHDAAGIVGYMCDNVEYHPTLVGTVNDYFEQHANRFAGYVMQLRDVWHRDGRDGTDYRAPASAWGHWDMLPPVQQTFAGSADGLLDHSQVFHRLPCDARWNEARDTVAHGDGVFFDRLIYYHGPLHQITGDVMVTEHLLK